MQKQTILDLIVRLGNVCLFAAKILSIEFSATTLRLFPPAIDLVAWKAQPFIINVINKILNTMLIYCTRRVRVKCRKHILAYVEN